MRSKAPLNRRSLLSMPSFLFRCQAVRDRLLLFPNEAGNDEGICEMHAALLFAQSPERREALSIFADITRFVHRRVCKLFRDWVCLKSRNLKNLKTGQAQGPKRRAAI